MKYIFIILFIFLASFSSAYALDYPAKEIDRPLTVSEGMIEPYLFFNLKGGDYIFDDNSDRKSNYEIYGFILNLGFHYGITDNLQFGIDMPFSNFQINSEDYELDSEMTISKYEASSTGFLGDIEISGIYQYLISKKQLSIIGVQLAFKIPTGQSEPLIAEFNPSIINPRTLHQSIPTGSGQFDISAALLLKLKLTKRFSFLTEAEYIVKLNGEIEREFKDLQGFSSSEDIEIDPGDAIKIDLLGIYQINKLIVSGMKTNYTLEQSDKEDNEDVEESDSYIFSISPYIQTQISPNLDLTSEVEIPLLGQNSIAAITFSLKTELRF